MDRWTAAIRSGEDDPVCVVVRNTFIDTVFAEDLEEENSRQLLRNQSWSGPSSSGTECSSSSDAVSEQTFSNQGKVPNPSNYHHQIWVSDDESAANASNYSGSVTSSSQVPEVAGHASRALLAQSGKEGLFLHSDGRAEFPLDLQDDADQQAWSETNKSESCEPCLYSKSKRGCPHGAACAYCHVDHATMRTRRARPSKAVRDRCKSKIGKLLIKLFESVEETDDVPSMLQENARAVLGNGVYSQRVLHFTRQGALAARSQASSSQDPQSSSARKSLISF
ncbi:unnamed protein product [Polarella glacialis]|uniref:C3H1-type domain-containing protein n=1 Tax=Polarella glacialis TaxID=89957 RepID=A0A813KM36_POLGL|nr:unnamed protein product [Polarella glacialis]